MLSTTSTDFAEVPPIISTVIGAARPVEKLKHFSRHPGEPPALSGHLFLAGLPLPGSNQSERQGPTPQA